MQVQIDELSSVQRKLSFTLPQERIDAALDTAYGNLRKDVRMKGFRQGKVPRQVLEQRFGRHIEGEVGGQLISEAFDAAIKERKIEPVSQPIVEKAPLLRGQDFTFSVIVEVRPTITVVGWEGMELPWETVEVPEELIAEHLERQRAQAGTVQVATADHAAAAGDYVLVEATLSAAGKEDKHFEGLMVLAGNATGLPISDALADRVLGMTTGGTATFAFDVPTGVDADWDGVSAQAAMTVQEIKARKEPALDDDFAKDVGFDSLDAMKADIQFKLHQGRSDEARARAAGRAIKQLASANVFDVPDGLVRIEGQALLDQSHQQMLSQGMRAPRLRLEQLNADSQAQVLSQATFSVRRSLILDSVATIAGIEVTDSDVEDKIVEIAGELGQQPAAVKGLLQKNHGMDELRSRLREDLAMDMILERGTIVDVAWGAQDPDADGSDGDGAGAPAQTTDGAEAVAAE